MIGVEPGTSEIEAGLSIQGCPDHTGPSPDLPHDPLKGIVGADLVPVDVWKGIVGQRLMDSLLDQIGRLAHLQQPQFGDDTGGFCIGRHATFLGVNRL